MAFDVANFTWLNYGGAARSKMCDVGGGVAVSTVLGVLVSSSVSKDTIKVYTLPKLATPDEAVVPSRELCVLGGRNALPPMKFLFGYYSGWMAFAPPTAAWPPLLLVTDAIQNSIHVIDVMRQAHVGYVNGFGGVPFPRGVAAKGCLVAVSCNWGLVSTQRHSMIRLFEGSGSHWVSQRSLADDLFGMPSGLRFSGDGTQLAVADSSNNRLYVINAEDGALVCAFPMTRAKDVEEVDNGWLSVSTERKRNLIHHILGPMKPGRAYTFSPGGATSLAYAPGLGYFVRHAKSDVELYAIKDFIEMEKRTSKARLAWMSAVWKGGLRFDLE